MNDPKGGESARALAGPAELDDLRREIDRVDREILERLNERARLVIEVGELKRERSLRIYRPERERDLVAALQAANAGPFPDQALPAVFREIVSATRSLERELRVAYMGPEGTFSHVAALETFGRRVQLLPEPTIREVFAAVERGAADHGVVPVENTTEGVVTQTLDVFIESSLSICGETVLPIAQSLVSRASRLEDVTRVASHPQPLAQCRRWLERHLPGVPHQEVASTAAAAAIAVEEDGVAAIGSALLAEVGGLAVLAEGIEDQRDNTTRFAVIGDATPAPSGNDLTTVVFTVRKGESGALHRLLEPFAEHGVNLASIQARPLPGTPWEYMFFLDLEGHRDEAAVQAALADASRVANSARVLGSFPRAIARGTASGARP